MNRKTWLLALLLCGVFMLGGCMVSPPQVLVRSGGEDHALINADPEELPADMRDVTLYYRYGDSSWLAPERRLIRVQRNESMEKALAEALIAEPSAPNLFPLFPAGTEVLAAVTQGDTLFVTFNEAFLGKYPDEPDNPTGVWRTEGPLRRQMCLDALAATMTEAGLCTRVQVLAYRSVGQSDTMRLQAGFLDRSDNASLLPPLTRSEERLLTPYNTAALILQAWQSRDWPALYDWTAREGSRPTEQTAMEAFGAGRVLTDFSLSPGTVSYDGQTAVVTAALTLQGPGGDEIQTGYPLRLIRESGRWKMAYERLIALMGETP